ncbi:MAG: VanZ family protein [Candidatus Cryptobacteroides sp.]
MAKSNRLALVLFLLYLAGVAYCCFGSFSGMPQVTPSLMGIPTDKIVHFCMFFPFPFLCYLTFDTHTSKPSHAVLLSIISFITGCIVAGGTEIGQSFLQYRSCDIKDFAADVLSLALSSCLTLYLDIRKMKNK